MPLKDMVIDLSHWNTITNPAQIKSSGVEGIIYKATEGVSYKDSTYQKAKNSASQYGFLFGAYHFLRPGDMRQQADHFVRTAGEIDLYAADHEDEGVTLDHLKIFLEQIHKATGKLAVIYSGHVLKQQLGDRYDKDLARHRLWLAQYTNGAPSWNRRTWPTWWIWQHTDKGSLPGISGAVDLNYYDGTPQQLTAEWAGEPAVPPEETEVVVKVTVPRGVKVVIEEV